MFWKLTYYMIHQEYAILVDVHDRMQSELAKPDQVRFVFLVRLVHGPECISVAHGVESLPW